MERARVRDCTHAPFVRVRAARSTLPPVFDLESAEARALEHALFSIVLERDLQVHAF